MAYQKRNTWWGVHPDKGKKGFSNQKDAEAYEGGKEKKEPAKEPVRTSLLLNEYV